MKLLFCVGVLVIMLFSNYIKISSGMRRYEGPPRVPISRNPDQQVNHENRPNFQQNNPYIQNNQLTQVPQIIPATKSLDLAAHEALYQKYYANYPQPPQEKDNAAYTLFKQHFGDHSPPANQVNPLASVPRNSRL
ncbi:uncharacterized protein LOC117170324 [Belonocnema kinseyi]|uniref:uncharacterized protein LOC117170324 n=1 Tax=Belonocnema kinseyi TaxID=2817044 RepID=UPI00143D7184|nr:uncharacterized protein LOC117170324 [Belonocnema kinseyi]